MSDIIVTNTTASGLTFGDLSGYTVPASGTVTLSDLFTYRRIMEAEDLLDAIQAEQIMVNDGASDLDADQALNFLTYTNAEYLHKFPLQDPLQSSVSGGWTIKYDEELGFMDQFEIAPTRFSELFDVSIEGDKYIITDSEGNRLVAVQDFLDLLDTPTTYSGSVNYIVTVTTSGLEFKSLQDIIIDEGIFGSHYYYNNDENTSTTTSLSYQQKLRLSVSNLPFGYYRIGYHYEWNCSSTSARFQGRVQLDDNDNISVVNITPSDSSVERFDTISGFVKKQLSGNHIIDIDFSSSRDTKTVSIRRARLEIWRVS